MTALKNICFRPSALRAAWIHLIHAAGGASGFITMVVMFVMLFVLFVRSRLVVITCRMYSRQVPDNNPNVGLEALLSEPPRLAPHQVVYYSYT